MSKPVYFVARVLRIGKRMNFVTVCDESPQFRTFVEARNWLRGHRAFGVRILRETADEIGIYVGC